MRSPSAKFLDITMDASFAVSVDMARASWYVYVLRSLLDRTRVYVGTTRNWHTILQAHNSGRYAASADGRPWAIDLLVRFADEARAAAFARHIDARTPRRSRREAPSRTASDPESS